MLCASRAGRASLGPVSVKTLRAAALAVVMAPACAPHCPPPAPHSVRPDATPPVDAVAQLRTKRFASGLRLQGRETGAVWIEVEVNGVSTKALLDTGAEFHAVQKWFVEAAGIGVEGEEEAKVTDSAKNTRAASFARVKGTIPDWGAIDTPAVLLPTFEVFEKARVGLILNPLLLAAPGRALRLDFAQSEMSELEQLSEPADEPVVLQTCTSVSRMKGGMVVTTLRAVTEVMVAGSATALTIDSGARTTVVAGGTSAASELEAIAKGTETAGGVFGTEEVKVIPEPVALEVAGTRFDVRGVRLAPPEPKRTSCNDEGVLGMDVLKHCVVELSLTDTRLSCRAP